MGEEIQSLLECKSTPPEAPASMTVRFASQLGYEYLLTVRNFEEMGGGSALLKTIPSIEGKLAELQCKPIFGRGNGGGKAEVEANPTQQPCPVHEGVMMDKHEKDGQIWYSHVIGKDKDGKSIYCKGKSKS